jgi:outer membrane protein assembly factor BamB
VLLYLDEGRYRWADVPVSGNYTALCATLAACAQADVALNYSMSQYGAYVTSLFGEKGPDDFSWWWELLLWNATALAWQEAPKGASDLELRMWDNIAWCPNSSAPPLPDPLTRYPSPKFRGDLANTGKALLPLPKLTSSSGYTGLGNGPIDSTPAVAHGRIYISTGGVYNWSTMTYEAQPQLWSIPAPPDRGISGPFIHRPTSAAGWQVSSPALGAGMAIVGTSDGKVMAFSMDRLEPLWNFSISPSATGVTASPVIFQGVIYVAGGDGLLYGLSTDGRMLWNLTLGGPAYMSTPAVSDGRLFVGSDAGVLTCAALNGTLLWNFSSGGKIRSSPAVSGGRVFFENTVYDGFTATGSALFSLFASNGTQEWNRTVPASTSSPAIADGRLFLGTNTGVSSYDLKGNLLWSRPTPGPIQSSPLVAGDVVVVTENSANGTVRYFSAIDGSELQSYTPRPEQYLFSSPVFTGDMLLVASDNGQIYHTDFKSYAAPRVVSWQIPKNLEPGKPVQVRVTLANQGNLTSRDIKLQLRGSQGRVFDSQLNISHLAPGHNVTAVFNWTPQEGDTGLALSLRDSQGDRGGSTRQVNIGKQPVPANWVIISATLLPMALMAAVLAVRRLRRRQDG